MLSGNFQVDKNPPAGNRPSRDIDDLKSRADLRKIASAYLGQPKRRSSKYDVYDSPLRNDGQHASFTVYSNRFIDYGGTQEQGSAIDFLMHVENLTVAQAIQRLEQITDGAPRIDPINKPHYSAQAEPPDMVWQGRALSALTICEAYLWSGRPDALRALDYLHGRGLTDDTIRAVRLGFSPRWQAIGWKDADGKAAGVWPGIVIPIFYSSTLWTLRVRELHTSLSAKYLNVTGSKLSGALYNGDGIRPGAPLLIVEGEFDAILAAQQLPGLAVITPGPVSNTLTKRQLEHIRQASAVYILMDNDSAGQNAAQIVTTAIGDKARILPALPVGKDVTEFVCEHSGDLAAWFVAATRRIPFPNGVPDSWRSALLNRAHFPDSYALYMELLNEGIRAGYINPNRFTTTDWLTANRELGFNISKSTACKALLAFIKIGFFSFVDSLKKTQYTNENNSGAPVKIYQLTDTTTWLRLILNWITPRLYEEMHVDSLATPTPAMVHDSGVSDADAQAIADELSSQIKSQDAKQIRRAQRELTRITESLKDSRSTPLPTDWPLNNAKVYRRAFTHAVAGGGQRSRPELCKLVGVRNTALSTVLRDAGIEQIAQYEEAEIKVKPERLEYELNRIGRCELDSPGMPVALVATLPDGKEIDRKIVREKDGGISTESVRFYTNVQHQGAQVIARFQIASHQKIVRSVPPAVSEPSEPPSPTPEPMSRPAKVDVSGPASRRRHYGPTYNPDWLSSQWWMTLRDKKGWIPHDPDQLIEPDTGQIARLDMQPIELLECILGRSIERKPDPLLQFAVSLGATPQRFDGIKQ
jgi:hypothetical protein